MTKAMNKRDGKSPSQRQLRVGEEIRHLLAGIIGRGELRDPDLRGRAVTVTEVRISPDLKNATAYVLPLGGQDSPIVMKALKRCSGFLRSTIGHHLTLRYTPSLDFALDTTFDEADRIDAILHRPDVQRDLAPLPEDDEA
jgi:ribosome-binding factor A